MYTVRLSRIRPRLEEIKALHPKGIIFTGGPNSVFDMSSPHYTKEILEIGVPILGICYGCQLIAWMGDGEVKTAPVSEYGKIDAAGNRPASALLSAGCAGRPPLYG